MIPSIVKSTPSLVIVNSDIDRTEFWNLFRSRERIPYKVDCQVEEIRINALSDDVEEYFACELDLSYINRFPNLRILDYEKRNGLCWVKIDLHPLVDCKSLEELYIEAGCGKPIDFTPILNHNLRLLGHQIYMILGVWFVWATLIPSMIVGAFIGERWGRRRGYMPYF